MMPLYLIVLLFDREIIDFTVTENFAEEPKEVKFLRAHTYHPGRWRLTKLAVFSGSVKISICCVLDVLLRDNMLMGAFRLFFVT